MKRLGVGLLVALLAAPVMAQQTVCAGDCAVDGDVGIDDVVTMVAIINGTTPLAACEAGDVNRDGRVRANEVTRAVRSVLEGCSAAAIGQAAFYRALNEVPATAEAQAAEEARAFTQLTAAVAEDPDDGWSWFLLGMYHMLRAGRVLTDYANPDPAAVEHVRQARTALDRAVPLLAHDDRIPGFRGAATYTLGVLDDDPELVALGLAQLDEAIEANFLFNSFSYLGTVAAATAPDDPLFAQAIVYLDAGIGSGCSPATDPRICGNEGRAPHNIQGSFLLFGDLYLKAGRLADARTWYEAARALAGEGYKYRAIIADRLEHFDARAALYADEDPANDPLLAGAGPESCVYCHTR